MIESAYQRPRSRVRISLVALALVAVLGALYGLTASWGLEGQTRDSLATAVPAWNLVENGSLDLSEYSDTDAWIVESETGYFTNRTPGLIAITAVGYLLASPWVDGFVFWPATLVAVVSTIGAVALMVFTARKFSEAPWIFGIVAVGLGTALWGIASDQIWPHGPAALMLAAAVLLIDSDHELLAGMALGVAILVRPPVAVIAAVLGIGLALTRRDWKPILRIGLPSGLGALAFLAYSAWMFGSASPTAVYDTQGGLGGPDSVFGWIGNVLGSLILPHHGILVWSLWIVFGVFALAKYRSELPSWAVPAILAALLYVMVHSAINRVSGGLTYNYRYQIEALAVAAPALIASTWKLYERRVVRVPVFMAVVISVGLQVIFVAVSECVATGPATFDCSLFGL